MAPASARLRQETRVFEEIDEMVSSPNKFEEMVNWWNGELLRQQVYKMVTKQQIDGMASWRNGKLMKLWIDEMVSWQNSEFTK